MWFCLARVIVIGARDYLNWGILFVFVVFFCLQFSTAAQRYTRTTRKSAARE